MNHAPRCLPTACLALSLLALPVAGCGEPTPPPPERPPLGAPIDVAAAPLNTWTWVDFPDAVCDDGSPTGLGFSKGASDRLLIFLNGGGACWENTTCFVLNTASHGPIGRPQFEQGLGQFPAGSLVDRARADNPFRDYNLVFLPYCTGDVHGGDNVPTYGMKPYYHKGRANLVAFLKRLAATWPTPEKVVFSGASAGGFGAALNYDLFRAYFPEGQAYLLDDSGPAFIGDDIPRTLRDAWYASWGLERTIGVSCPGCRDDLSAMVPLLAQRFPKDRMALLSYTQDSTIRGFYLQSGMDFEVNLLRLARERIEPIPNFRYFFVTGSRHTMVGQPAMHQVQGTSLWTWLGQFIGDDEAWRSLKP